MSEAAIPTATELNHRARWERPALGVLLVATALLYPWGLGSSGWANTFYSAAVQAGTKSWEAFFFGSSDAANFITVDKIPGSLWIMELSARVFGVNSWSILVPQALEGVASVGVLYATVRRWFSPAAALLAGSVLALTPVATLMFRFNNPDALLVLLLTAGAYAITRACERGATKWVLLTGAFVGFAFLAKMMQAFVIVPVFALMYIVAAPVSWKRRIVQLILGGAAMVAAGGWWLLAVTLTPASHRPYVGGSQNNSIWDLMFGYNGFGRLTGHEAGSVGGGGSPAGAGGGMWGSTGITRLFGSDMGSQISWLLPAALIFTVAVIALRGRAARTDRTRAAMVLWGGWAIVTGAVISFGQGIIHPYYTVAIAPGIGGAVGIGTVWLWKRRTRVEVRVILSVTIAVTAVWAYHVLGRTDWNNWLRYVVLLSGLPLAVAVAGLPSLKGRIAMAVASLAVVVGLAAPTAYSLQTASVAHTGALPAAGPGSSMSRPGGGGRGTGGGGGGANRPSFRNRGARTFGGGGFGGPPQGGAGVGGGRGGGGGMSGLLEGSTPSSALTTLLKADASKFTWTAAVIRSNQAAGYQLASGAPVMAIGGFNGTDPAPTLAQFEKYVDQGAVHYFISSGTGGGGGFGRQSSDSGTSSEITSWVQANYTATTVGGVTVYDLTAPISIAAATTSTNP